jgi:hypothetical protein
MQDKDFTVYGRNYLATVVPNFLGTRFEVYNYGLESGYILQKDVPQGLLPIRSRVCTIEYDTNFFAEKPRSFRVKVVEDEKERFFENLPPKFN